MDEELDDPKKKSWILKEYYYMLGANCRFFEEERVHGTATNCEVGGWAPLGVEPAEIHFCSKPWTIWPCVLAYTKDVGHEAKLSSALCMLTIYEPGDFVFFHCGLQKFIVLKQNISRPLDLLVVSPQRAPSSCWLWWRQPPLTYWFHTRKSTVSSPTDSWIIG